MLNKPEVSVSPVILELCYFLLAPVCHAYSHSLQNNQCVRGSKPRIGELEPGTVEHKPGTVEHEPGTLELEPEIRELEPGTGEFEPGIREIEPGIGKLEPE